MMSFGKILNAYLQFLYIIFSEAWGNYFAVLQCAYCVGQCLSETEYQAWLRKGDLCVCMCVSGGEVLVKYFKFAVNKRILGQI